MPLGFAEENCPAVAHPQHGCLPEAAVPKACFGVEHEIN